MSVETTKYFGGLVERTDCGHELVVVTEWADEPATSLETLATFDSRRRRYWRCLSCGREHTAPSEFTEACQAQADPSDSTLSQ